MRNFNVLAMHHLKILVNLHSFIVQDVFNLIIMVPYGFVSINKYLTVFFFGVIDTKVR